MATSDATTTMPAAPAQSGPPYVDGTMGRRLVNGFAWGMLAMGMAQTSRVVVGLVLARVLTPRDFGLAGMALVFSSLVLALSDLSLSSGLIQRRQITEADRSTVFWTSLGIGVLLTVGGIAAAGPLAAFYGEPRVKPLFILLSLSFVLVALQVTQASLLLREMHYKVVSLRLAVGAALGGAVGITAALLGAGPSALIAQQLTAAGVNTVIVWAYSSWRPKFVYSIASLRDLGCFGLNIFGARVLEYLNRNADNVLIGRFLGSASLGVYSVAYNLMLLPLERLILPIQDTLFPAYARWQDDRAKVRTVWLKVLRLVAAVVTPLMLGLAVVAPDFVRVVLGHRWSTVTPVLQILAVVAIVQSLALLGQRLLQALDRTTTILRFAVLECCLTIPAFAIGLRFGVVGVARCYLAVTLPIQGAFLLVTLRAVGASVRDLLSTLAGPLEAALGMAGLCWLARVGLGEMSVPPSIRLIAVVLAGAVTFPLLCAWRAPDVVAEVSGHLRAASRRRALSRSGVSYAGADG